MTLRDKKALIGFMLCVAFSSSVAWAQKDPPFVKPKTHDAQPPVVVKKPAQGDLVVFSEPAEAQVFINHKLRGTTAADGTLSKPIALKPGTYQIEVRSPEYDDFRQEFIIRAGEPTQVRALLRAKFGYLVLTFAKPVPGVQIQLDGKEPVPGDIIRDSETTLRIKSTPGKHQVSIAATGYVPYRAEVEIPNTVPISLERAQAALMVNSLAGTRVYVNGTAEGIIPGSGQLLVSSFPPDVQNKVLLERDGYEKFEKTILVEAGKTQPLEARLTPLPTTTEFSDSFQDGLIYWNAPPEWTADKGVMNVHPSKTVGMPKEKRFCDHEVIFGLRLANDRGAAWMVRAQNEKRFYLFRLNGPGGQSPNKFQTYLCQDGIVSLGEPASPSLPIQPLKMGETYRIRIRIQGNTIQHWITPTNAGEEISIGLFTDPNTVFPCGNIGFATPHGEDFQVNGLVVEPLRK